MGAYGLFHVKLIAGLSQELMLKDLAEVLDHALGIMLPLGLFIFILAVCTEVEAEIPIIDRRFCPQGTGAQLLFGAVIIYRMEVAGKLTLWSQAPVEEEFTR